MGGGGGWGAGGTWGKRRLLRNREENSDGAATALRFSPALTCRPAFLSAIVPLLQIPWVVTISHGGQPSSPWIMLASPGATRSGTVVPAAISSMSSRPSSDRSRACRIAAVAIATVEQTVSCCLLIA